MTLHLVDLYLAEAGHLLDARQPSQQSSALIRENLLASIAAVNQVAAGFYRHWLHLAFA
jgi:hypothetical protein